MPDGSEGDKSDEDGANGDDTSKEERMSAQELATLVWELEMLDKHMRVTGAGDATLLRDAATAAAERSAHSSRRPSASQGLTASSSSSSSSNETSHDGAGADDDDVVVVDAAGAAVKAVFDDDSSMTQHSTAASSTDTGTDASQPAVGEGAVRTAEEILSSHAAGGPRGGFTAAEFAKWWAECAHARVFSHALEDVLHLTFLVPPPDRAVEARVMLRRFERDRLVGW